MLLPDRRPPSREGDLSYPVNEETKVKMDLLREKLGNAFLSMLSQAKATLVARAASPIDVTVADAIDYLYERVERAS